MAQFARQPRFGYARQSSTGPYTGPTSHQGETAVNGAHEISAMRSHAVVHMPRQIHERVRQPIPLRCNDRHSEGRTTGGGDGERAG